MIKYGFLIKGGEIYDTKIQSYVLTTTEIGSNVIYAMKPTKYRRLYLFEPLLDKFSEDTVFELLKFNRHLASERKSEELIKTNKLDTMANMAVIYNYPPSYLTQKKFSIYKICQSLKKRLD